METPITLQENEKVTYKITVLKSTGEVQRGVYAKIFGKFEKFEADENGIITLTFSKSSYSQSATLYMKGASDQYSKSINIDSENPNQTFYFDSQEDIINYKRNAITFPIEGMVMDNEGSPIERATVSIQGTGRKTLTDEIGLFNIDADFNHSIVIRADGMDNQSFSIEHFLQRDKDNVITMKRKNSYEIYSSVQNMPEYPGGMKAFHQYLDKNLEYPAQAKKRKIEGVVVVQFVVEKNGEISNSKIARHLETSLDSAALKAINTMPNWIPGSDFGRKVRCKYSLPIAFKIPIPKPVPPADSLKLAKDSLKNDSLLALRDSLAMDSLRNDSAKLRKGLLADSLKNDSLMLNLIPNDSLQQDSTRIMLDKDQPTVKAKKRNIFARFFRWLFGIERRQRKRAEREQLLKTKADSLQIASDSLRLGSKVMLRTDSNSVRLEVDSLNVNTKELKEKIEELSKKAK